MMQVMHFVVLWLFLGGLRLIWGSNFQASLIEVLIYQKRLISVIDIFSMSWMVVRLALLIR